MRAGNGRHDCRYGEEIEVGRGDPHGESRVEIILVGVFVGSISVAPGQNDGL